MNLSKGREGHLSHFGKGSSARLKSESSTIEHLRADPDQFKHGDHHGWSYCMRKS